MTTAIPASTAYLFNGSNIGPSGLLSDALNIPEMLFFMQKKFLGIPLTVPDTVYSTEAQPNNKTFTQNSFPNSHFIKRYAQLVPLSNYMSPSATSFGVFNITRARIDNNFSQNFVNLIPSKFFDKVFTYQANTSRYISLSEPYIVYYSNILLEPIGSFINSDKYSNFCPTYGHPLLVNSISQYYDISYSPRLVFSNTRIQIFPTNGYWLLDNDSGLLTFYDSNTSGNQVSTSNPPRISFYRYEGLFGEANILQGQDL